MNRSAGQKKCCLVYARPWHDEMVQKDFREMPSLYCFLTVCLAWPKCAFWGTMVDLNKCLSSDHRSAICIEREISVAGASTQCSKRFRSPRGYRPRHTMSRRKEIHNGGRNAKNIMSRVSLGLAYTISWNFHNKFVSEA